MKKRQKLRVENLKKNFKETNRKTVNRKLFTILEKRGGLRGVYPFFFTKIMIYRVSFVVFICYMTQRIQYF